MDQIPSEHHWLKKHTKQQLIIAYLISNNVVLMTILMLLILRVLFPHKPIQLTAASLSNIQNSNRSSLRFQLRKLTDLANCCS